MDAPDEDDLGDDAATGLSGSLRSAGFALGRLQTGTPARLRAKTINFAHPALEVQEGDAVPEAFSYLPGTLPDMVRDSFVRLYMVLCEMRLIYAG